MATEQMVKSVTIPASGDLSAGQYLFVDVNSSGQAAVVASAGAIGVGVLQNAPAAAGRDAEVGISGITKVVAGDSVTAGDLIQSDASGKAITAATSDFVLGKAITGGAASAVISVLLFGPYLSAAGG